MKTVEIMQRIEDMDRIRGMVSSQGINTVIMVELEENKTIVHGV